MPGRVKLGVIVWNQYTDWPCLRDAGVLVDELGYDSLWTWDHLYPIIGSHEGPMFEGYLTVASWAERTTRATVGLMVGANTFRNPAHVVKLVTQIDHMSGGRAVLGIGGAWFETEHTAFGIDFGSGFGERLDRLDEAVDLMHQMLRTGRGSARGPVYSARDVRNDPPPLQERLPIAIGGGGERKTLATVARYADLWNVGGSVEEVGRKDEVLRRWCGEVGRDESEIERSLAARAIVVRDTMEEAERVSRALGRHNGGSEGAHLYGPPEHVAERLAPYVELGFRHLVLGAPAPYDRESLERMLGDVKPLLERV